MKRIICLMALVTVISTHNCIADARISNLEELKRDAQRFIGDEAFETAGCSFRLESSRWDMSLRMTSDRKQLEVSMNKRSRITVSEKKSSDGSYTRTYFIKDTGSFGITHMDDAYDSLTLTSKDDSIDCVVEY
jgi:hypothetical protein